jgi:hypothetical protein
MWKGGQATCWNGLLLLLSVLLVTVNAEQNASKSVTNKQCVNCYAFVSSSVFCFAFAIFYKETNIFTAISNITSTCGIHIQ